MTTPAQSTTHGLLKIRLNALLRENDAAEQQLIDLGEQILSCYATLKNSGFAPHDAEMALVFATREMLETLWYQDRQP